ncbi:uncharacterized protein LOC128387209 [Panonychus citri]|uniref:uncharacterized protein LOC128387209 n=1 Tax=Panonychus citri TaxID=50023 RepID=UPI002307C8C2|nr:uncharacterized protein LOC128387209 [Panonychus citri]
MCLIVVTICSNLVLTMGLTFVSRRDYNRYPFDYNNDYHQLIRPYRSIKSQSDDDWNLIKDEISNQSKQSIKPVSFSNFLKSRSPNQQDEKTFKGKTNSSKKDKSKKRKTQNDDEEDDDDGEENEEDDGELDEDEDEDNTNGGKDEEMSASSGLDLGVLGQVDEMMAMVEKNTILPDGIHFDDSKLLEGNSKVTVKSGSRKKPRRQKEQVKVIRRSPHRSVNRKLLRALKRKTKPKANIFVPVARRPHHLDGNAHRLVQNQPISESDDSGLDEIPGDDNDQDDDFGLASVGKKVSPANLMSDLRGSLMPTIDRNKKRPSKGHLSPSHIDSLYNQRILSGSLARKKKKSPLKMNDDLEIDDEDLQKFEKSIFDDSILYPDDYIVVPRTEKGMANNQDTIPFQYNVEIRSRKNLKVKADPESLSSSERYKKHEQKEEEHWHEKKWTKTGRFELSQFSDQGSVVAGDDSEDNQDEQNKGRKQKKIKAKRRKKKKMKKVKKEESHFDDLLHDEDGGHFDIPSKGFRINKRFVDWTENKINLD